VLSYGLFNSLYYAGTFLFIWYMAKVPMGLGWRCAIQRCAEVLALTWAGSQVTKVARAGAALLFAPLVDRGLVWLQSAAGFKSRRAVRGLDGADRGQHCCFEPSPCPLFLHFCALSPLLPAFKPPILPALPAGLLDGGGRLRLLCSSALLGGGVTLVLMAIKMQVYICSGCGM
jgi:hypothetical protein